MSDISVGSKEVIVTRVCVTLPEVNRDYARVELIIGGREFEMSGPDAQILGHKLARAGGDDKPL
jgi:hypothetical protein